jgi:hypothetical protein
MFATAVTLTVIAVAIAGITDLVREDGAKIIAALQGRSGIAGPTPTLPAIVRFNPRYTVEEREFARPALRAAA